MEETREKAPEGVARGEFLLAGQVRSRRNPLIIAELGTSHGADPVKARELVSAAAEAGAGCVKFQMVYADEILHPNTGEVRLPGGMIRLYDTFKRLETPPEFYAEMKECVEGRGLIFLCTAFGPRSAAEITALKPALLKIASPELNYGPLLAQTASAGLPLLLSTGVSKLGDIEAALEIAEEAAPEPARICLLHCVTSYPAPERDYNLRVLESLRAVFGVAVGVSDHSLDPELVPALALTQGAAVIEKHFCLSRNDPGLDDPIALPPEDFARMVRAVGRAAAAAGGEAAFIEELKRERGAELVEAVLGDGVKRLAPSERANYERSNRSIHALRDIQEGELITAEITGILRTEKVLRPGLPPAWRDRILGRRARRFIPAGEGIRLEDI
ncbi:MAG: N-acetylneuraminate synthase family protein [Spirochaetaceae bacterium]|jgi:sialic acid synthase SpsE|nr:N-acetylneuraminate synthase family protein [Spirochaetaceae bacterium]